MTGTQNTNIDLRISVKYDGILGFPFSLGSNFFRFVVLKNRETDHFGKLRMDFDINDLLTYTENKGFLATSLVHLN